jgi:hypothetical protein
MTADYNRRISVDYALVWVARAMYGKDWISPPTKYEQDLVEEYGERPANASSIIPGMITYTSAEGGNRRWGERPNASRLADEIEQALHRHRMRERQFWQAIEWLEDHGFDWHAVSFSLDEFYKELKKAFPHVRLRSANAGEPQALNCPPLNPQTALVPAPATNPSTQLAAVIEVARPRKGGRPGDLGDRYRAEFRKRREEGIALCASKAAEAAAIVAALQERDDLPKNPPPSTRTAENALTKLYNEAKALNPA